MAYFMESVHWLDAFNPPLETHLHRLAEGLKSLLELDSKTAGVPNALVPANDAPSDKPNVSSMFSFIAESKQPPNNKRAAIIVLRVIAAIAIIVLGSAGVIFLGAMIDLLTKSGEIATIIVCGLLGGAAFVAAYMVYRIGIYQR